ncbi:ribosome-inactivating family protein [Streptomyces sviceus]|uniref:ribosome-inactivating family protein n=1 Tax=Streptomyces sviceus TaxID=285530 RepID=UPI00367992C6
MARTALAAAPPGRRTRGFTVASILTTLLLALVATLMGPLGALQKAAAEDGNPTFYLGEHDGSDYVNFINRIRSIVNDGGSTSVPGAGGAYQVNHLDPNNRAMYLQVDIHTLTGEFVRLQLDRRNLYLLGWWSHDNTYYYLGNRPGDTPPYGERGRTDNGRFRDAEHWRQISSENYSRLEADAGENRADMPISSQSINAAAMFMYSRNPNYDNHDRARGALRMTQFISEAARFRPIRDDIAQVIGHHGTLYMPAEYARMENAWSTLSTRFNELLHHPQNYQDPHPLTSWRRDTLGSPVKIILTKAILYAQYILATSNGR